MYIKLKNGAVEKYPYTVENLKKDNPQVSFPATLPDSVLADYGIYKVQQVAKPSIADANVFEGTPVLEGSTWKQVWNVAPLSYEERLNRVKQARAESYPPITDYLDGIVKGDAAQIEKYINDCKAVKAKYPKP